MVVSVDPWPDSYGYHDFPDLQKFKGRGTRMYDAFLTLNSDTGTGWPPCGSSAGPLAVS